MKMSFLAGLLSCLAAAQPATFGHSQGANMLASTSKQITAIIPDDKKPTIYVDQSGATVRPKVINTFEQLFESPRDVQWNLNGKYYLASFKENGQLCKALFGLQGSMQYCMKYGTQENLPRDVYRLVKSNYIDYNISNVTEVTTPEAQAWVVSLEDKDNLIQAKVVDGQLEEMHHYKTHL